MSNQDYPSLNGNAASWADINVTATPNGAALIDMADIASLKWGRKVEVGEQRGASGGRVMKRTTGSGSQQASCELYRSGMRTLITALAAIAPTRGSQKRISLVKFTFDVQHSVPGDPTIFHVRLKGCQYFGDDDDMKEGPDADKISIELNPIEIANVINGQEVVLL